MSNETDSEEDWMTERDAQADEEVAICRMCGQTFPTQVELSQHLMDEHDDDGLPTPGPSEPDESESQEP
jgi:hypothetical protein